MAALDGIKRQIDPGEPLDRDIYEMSSADLANVPSTPATLADALQALEADHEFLLQGDVFTEDLIKAWVDYKWRFEIKEMRIRPHPYEFYLYYDA